MGSAWVRRAEYGVAVGVGRTTRMVDRGRLASSDLCMAEDTPSRDAGMDRSNGFMFRTYPVDDVGMTRKEGYKKSCRVEQVQARESFSSLLLLYSQVKLCAQKFNREILVPDFRDPLTTLANAHLCLMNRVSHTLLYLIITHTHTKDDK